MKTTTSIKKKKAKNPRLGGYQGLVVPWDHSDTLTPAQIDEVRRDYAAFQAGTLILVDNTLEGLADRWGISLSRLKQISGHAAIVA